MTGQFENKTDTVILIFSALAVLVAGTLSMATISQDRQVDPFDSANPTQRAEAAAVAGLDAARWHIECHGRVSSGGLTPKYYANGGIYEVEWDDVNMTDSTVMVRSRGDFSWGDDKHYEVNLESKIKLEFLPSHNQKIMDAYYTGHKNINQPG